MKKNYAIFLSLFVLGMACLAQQKNNDFNFDWTKKVGASKTPAGKIVFNVNNYGAVNDGITLSTNAIQKAIDDCAAKGGGIVSFNAGTYVMGSVFVKENVHLKIDKGVVILGSQDFKDYPEMDTRIAGIEMKWPAALINVVNAKNAMVSGEGVINARGKFCWDKYWAMRKDYDAKGLRWIVDYDAKRVRTFLVQNSSDVTLKGLTFENAGFWTIQLLYSDRLTVAGVTVKNNKDGKGPSTDGIDIDSSTWVLIENCDIDCNDDDFCLKAGRDWDGLRVNKPTEYVVIRKCIARKGGGLLTLGSETSGYIRHVLATELIAMGTGNGFHIKSATTRGGGVEDIHFEHIRMDSVKNVFHFTMNWNPAYSYSKLPEGVRADTIPAHWKTMLNKVEPAEKGTPHFKDVYIKDVVVNSAKKIILAEGMQQSPLLNFNFQNVNIKGDEKGKIEFADSWTFDHVILEAKNPAALEITNSNKVNYTQNDK